MAEIVRFSTIHDRRKQVFVVRDAQLREFNEMNKDEQEDWLAKRQPKTEESIYIEDETNIVIEADKPKLEWPRDAINVVLRQQPLGQDNIFEVYLQPLVDGDEPLKVKEFPDTELGCHEMDTFTRGLQDLIDEAMKR